MDMLIGGTVFGQVQHIGSSMSRPIKQGLSSDVSATEERTSSSIKEDPSSDASDTEESPGTKEETTLTSLPSWPDSYTYDPVAGVGIEVNEAAAQLQMNQPPATSRSNENEDEFMADTDPGREPNEFLSISGLEPAYPHGANPHWEPPPNLAWPSTASPPSPNTPEARLVGTDAGFDVPYSPDGVSHFGFHPNYCYFFSYGYSMLQEADLKLPPRPNWQESNEMDRKLPGRTQRAGDFPLQQASTRPNPPLALPSQGVSAVASLHVGDSLDDPSGFPLTRAAPPVASLHNANNPPSSPLVPQRRSARRRNMTKSGGANSSPQSPDTGGSSSNESPARRMTHWRFHPRKAELNEESNERGRKAVHSWYTRLNEYDEYRKFHGHGNVPQKYPRNPKLGIWVNKQRMEMKSRKEGKPQNKMSDWKIERLEEAEFVWAKPKGQESWKSQYEALVAYRDREGHCNVPTKYADDKSLGRWVSTQRSNYKKYKNKEDVKIDGQEMERRISLLEAIGFSWSLMPSPTGSTSSESHFKQEE